jgi:PKD repeat protein
VPLNGAILRVNPDTGDALPDNPMAGDPNPNRRRIIAYGLRNPYRFTFRPGTSEIWFGDVGWDTWEEINRLPDPLSPTVRNYGWPCYEGDGRMGSYDSLSLNLCETLYAQGASAVTPPYFAYMHGGLVDDDPSCPAGTSSTTGVLFYTATKFPAQYRGGLFFADYARNCIFFMPKGANGLPDPNQAQVFASGAAGPVDIQLGPDGAIYYTNLEGNAIRRIAFPAGNDTPTARISADTTSGHTPLTVHFDGSSSTDPDNDPLTYAWDLDGDGQYDDGNGVTASFTYTTEGNYTAHLRVTDPSGATDTTTVPITAGDPPVPTIATPSPSLTFAVGDQISFSGSAVDAHGTPIPASGLSWALNIRHCARNDATNCHTHFAQTFPGVASGTFNAPDHDYPSHLELILTATDAHGLSASTTVALQPKTVQVTLDSDPAGAQLTIGADTHTAPFTETFIQKSSTAITAPTPQTIGASDYTFSGWSDGGSVTHTINTGTTDATYKATFAKITGQKLAGADVIGTNTSAADVGRGEVYRTTATAAGTATSLRLYVDAGSTATQLGLGLYANASNKPGALLGQGKITTVAPGAWNDVPLPSGIPLTNGTVYWIGLLNPSTGTGTLRWRDRAGGSGGAEQTSRNGGLATLPASWTAGGSYTDGPLSAYAFGGTGGSQPPSLAVSPTSLGFTGSGSKTVSVSNTGGGALNFTASDDASWMSVSPAGGAAPQDVTVTVDATGLAPGTFNGNVTITATGVTGSPKTVPVTLTVSAPSSGLVGAWGFDETSGSTTADASGKGNTGTISNATRTASGKFGRALTFNSTNAWVTVADSTSLHLTSGMTVEGWVNPTALAGSWRALAVKETAGGLAWALYPAGDGGFPSGHAFTSAEQWARGTAVLPLNAWSHVATTYDGSTIRTYVNGVQVGTQAQTGSLVTSTRPLRFGGDSVWPEWFKGSLDEIRIYDRALTAAQIQGDMSRAVSGT